MARKSVRYLMTLKADVADRKQELHETAVDLEAVCSDIEAITTEEARCESNLDDLIKQARKLNHSIRNQFKYLDNSIHALRKSFGFNSLQK